MKNQRIQDGRLKSNIFQEPGTIDYDYILIEVCKIMKLDG